MYRSEILIYCKTCRDQFYFMNIGRYKFLAILMKHLKHDSAFDKIFPT